MAWQRHIIHTRTVTRTTWRFRLAVMAAVLVAALATRGIWAARLGQSLVCPEDLAPSDLILIENFDPDYVVFERAAALQAAGFAPRALVPIQSLGTQANPNLVSKGIAEVMARYARLASWEALPIREVEPITLNAGMQLRDHLVKAGVRSLILVTPGFRSRRSTLAYRAVLEPAGIRVRCVPVFNRTTPTNWTRTWHGIQDVGEALAKLAYYRLYVLPFRA